MGGIPSRQARQLKVKDIARNKRFVKCVMLHYPIVLLNTLSSIFLPIISGHPILQNIREVSTIHTATFGHHALGHGPLFLQVLATATGREMMSDDHLRRHWEKKLGRFGNNTVWERDRIKRMFLFTNLC